jgi:hypothetical protein
MKAHLYAPWLAVVLCLGSSCSALAQSIAPNPFDFGSVEIGSTSAVQVFTYTNGSPDPATISSTALGGAQPGQYQLAATTCTLGAVIAAAGTCTVSVRFAPTAAGSQVALIRLQYTLPPPNGPGLFESNAVLFGNGLPPALPAVPAPGPGGLALLIAVLAPLATGLRRAHRRASAAPRSPPARLSVRPPRPGSRMGGNPPGEGPINPSVA